MYGIMFGAGVRMTSVQLVVNLQPGRYVVVRATNEGTNEKTNAQDAPSNREITYVYVDG